jgi:5-methylcytosine-specific restriction endonuclease McrA
VTGRIAKLNPEDTVQNGVKRSDYNAYMRDYMLRRYHRRRAAFIGERGGVCVQCGSSRDLEIDHADRLTKAFDVGSALTSMSAAKLAVELEKCQLLCHVCHKDKSITELGRQRWRHGTLSGYRYCRCDECRTAKSVYSAAAYQRRKLVPPVGIEPTTSGVKIRSSTN